MGKTYYRALEETLKSADAAPIRKGRTREQIEADIASITESLRGPLDNVERICLCGDRRELQKELTAAR